MADLVLKHVRYNNLTWVLEYADKLNHSKSLKDPKIHIDHKGNGYDCELEVTVVKLWDNEGRRKCLEDICNLAYNKPFIQKDEPAILKEELY